MRNLHLIGLRHLFSSPDLRGQLRPEYPGNIAEQYLKSMGYGENPYLIYFHKDTNNNHVHMVSTRVDKNGKKIDDRYEKIRSQKVLQSILDQDPAIQAKSAVGQAMQYNFSTKAQFKLLLELQGYKVSEGEGELKIIKYGTVQTAVTSDELRQVRSGLSIDRTRTSVSMNEYMDNLIPASKIAALKAGEIVAQIGREADEHASNHSTYHCKVDIDPAIAIREEKSYHTMPKYYDFGSKEEKERTLRNHMIQISWEVMDVISSFQ